MDHLGREGTTLMCAARQLGPWDGDLLVRWVASPYLRRIPEPEPGAFYLWRKPTSEKLSIACVIVGDVRPSGWPAEST